MKVSTRIARTVAVATLAISGTIALAPAVSATGHGPSGEIGNPPTCTHGCDDGPGFGGPDDFTTPTPPPVVDPQPPTGEPVDQPVDQPVVVAQPTFTG